MSRAQVGPARRVILCADDFAVHQSASLGIAKLAALGRISATSAMVLSPRWARDAALLRDLRTRIDVGLHLDWTSAFAVGAGHGLTLPNAMLKALLGGFGAARSGSTTRVVIERQLDAFEAQWKAPPDFVDGHQHVQQFAGIRDALVPLLAGRYGAGQRADGNTSGLPYLRISRAASGLADLKSRVIAAMGAGALERLACGASLRVASGLSGIYDFAGNELRYAALMQGWLRSAASGTIIMCHPAQAAEPGDAIGVARAQEYNYLCGAGFDAALAGAGVQLVRGALP